MSRADREPSRTPLLKRPGARFSFRVAVIGLMAGMLVLAGASLAAARLLGTSNRADAPPRSPQAMQAFAYPSPTPLRNTLTATPTEPPAGPTPAPSSPPTAGPSAPVAASTGEDFSIQTVDGATFHLADQRGKVVGIFFMAGWCASCVPETQAWARLQQDFGDKGLEVLIVSVDSGDTPASLAEFRRFAREAPARYWAIDKTMQALVVPFQVRSLDTTLIFDRQGQLVYRDAFPTSYDRLKQEVEKVL